MALIYFQGSPRVSNTQCAANWSVKSKMRKTNFEFSQIRRKEQAGQAYTIVACKVRDKDFHRGRVTDWLFLAAGFIYISLPLSCSYSISIFSVTHFFILFTYNEPEGSVWPIAQCPSPSWRDLKNKENNLELEFQVKPFFCILYLYKGFSCTLA